MAKEPAPAILDALIARLVTGDVPALGRCITLVEDSELGAAVRQRIRPFAGRGNIIGFTGAPGVGKSTLVDAFIAELRRAGRSVAAAECAAANVRRWERLARNFAVLNFCLEQCA